MSRARDLTLGPRRGRSAQPGSGPDWTLLRRLTAAERPDLDTFRAVLDRLGAQAARPRFAEGAAYIAGCARYTALTGEQYGPVPGTY